MRRRSRAGGKSPNAQAPKAAARKRRIAPKAGHPRSTSTADLETEVARFARERDEALEQQAATSEVLNAISRSTFDLPTILSTVVETAARLCKADKAQILLPSENANTLYSAGSFGYAPEYNEYLKTITFAPGREGVVGRVLLERKPVQIDDVLADPEYRLRKVQQLGGFRTHLGLPLLRENRIIGVLLVSRVVVRPFEEQHIELLRTFAAQAVIAIENARLLNELRESLQQQTATADVLKVISRSTFDLQTVLDTLTESAAKLCAADKVAIWQRDAEFLRLTANYRIRPEAVQYLAEHPLRADRSSVTGRALVEGRAIHVTDVASDPEYGAAGLSVVDVYRTVLGVPLVRGGTIIGLFGLTRDEVNPFTDKQIELLTTFADQAVIAIENTRLLNELRQRTDDLTESLEQQTATSKVLEVISRSAFDLQTVLNTLVESVGRLCDAERTIIFRPHNDAYRLVASYGYSEEFRELLAAELFKPGRDSVSGRTAAEKTIVHILDYQADPELRFRGPFEVPTRTILGVPLLREGALVGIMTLARSVVQPFNAKQIELATVFAAQAVIAIENTRLLSELRQRTANLTESLEQQTATSKVLEVISRSAFDLHAVFEAVAESSVRLCGADRANIFRFDGDCCGWRRRSTLPRKKSDSTRPAQRCRPCRARTPNDPRCRCLGRSGAHVRGEKYRAVPHRSRGADPQRR